MSVRSAAIMGIRKKYSELRHSEVSNHKQLLKQLEEDAKRDRYDLERTHAHDVDRLNETHAMAMADLLKRENEEVDAARIQ
jgi:hypothetical protein